MPARNRYRALARRIEGSLKISDITKTRIPIHLTREEWGVVVAALKEKGRALAQQAKDQGGADAP